VWEKKEHPRLQQNVNVWDFGGQEFYHATHRLFLSSNAVTLVLFDKTTNDQELVSTKVQIRKVEFVRKTDIDLV
jgi:GTPase SAR1 family protein